VISPLNPFGTKLPSGSCLTGSKTFIEVSILGKYSALLAFLSNSADFLAISAESF
jgi:hypothetical protein